MKAILSVGLVAALGWASTAAELKIGTVDLQRAMNEYYKAQDAARQFKQREASYLKELDGLRLEGNRLVEDARQLEERTANNALSITQREENRKLFEQRRIDVREFQVRYDQFRAQKETDLQNYSLRTKKAILDDVISVTKHIGEKEGFNLVLNANKTEPAAGDVLFSRNVDDITEKVLASLNAARPKEAP